MKKTNIQWTDATWNIARGCTKVDEDCKFCYMYRDSLSSTRYNPLQVTRTKTVFDFPLKYKQTKSDCWNGPPLVFTSSLTDVFHPAIDSYRNEMWDIIRKCPHLTFQILTKRPERIAHCLPEDWGEGWDNVWLGTSVGSNDGRHRIEELAWIPAKTRFISFEPLHQFVDLSFPSGSLAQYDWAIIGAESGNDNGKYRYRPCDLMWIELMTYELMERGIAVFIKQLGTHLSKELLMTDRHGGNIEEFPSYLRIREFPGEKKNLKLQKKLDKHITKLIMSK